MNSKFKAVELHLNPMPEFTRLFGKMIKSVGGHYGAARGMADSRLCVIPMTSTNLINRIVRWNSTFRKQTTMIARDLVNDNFERHAPAWVTVYKYATGSPQEPCEALSVYVEKMLKNCIDRQIIQDSETDPNEPTVLSETALKLDRYTSAKEQEKYLFNQLLAARRELLKIAAETTQDQSLSDSTRLDAACQFNRMNVLLKEV